MKTKNIQLTTQGIKIIIPALFLMLLSCDQSEKALPPDMPLSGTVWKLEGFGSPDSIKLAMAVPDTKTNFQLFLHPGGEAIGISSVNYLGGKYTLDEKRQTLDINLQVLTSALDTPDGLFYAERLSKIYRYELKGDILRLYHSEGKYLQFRPAEDDSRLKEIVTIFTWRTPPAGMLWKLEGFGSGNGTLTTARPNNKESYLLYLHNSLYAFGTTSVNTFRAEYKVDTTLGALSFGTPGSTKINEQQDGKRYSDCLSRVTRYQFDDTTLRLYYSATEYLQYRPAADDTYFREEITRHFGEVLW